MTSNPKEPKDLGIEIAPSKIAKLWMDVIEKVEKDIEMDINVILVNKNIVIMARQKLKEEKDLYISKDKD